MAGNNIYWDGGTDGEPTTGNNWSDAGEPDATDVAIIPAYSVTAGDASVDTILGSAAFPSATDVQSMIIEEGGSYTIGTRLLPLTIKFADLATADLAIGGTGTYFLTPVNYDTITITEAGAAPGTGEYAVNLTAMTHASATAVGAIHVNCESNMSVGIGAENSTVTEVDTIHVSGGDVTVGRGCVDTAGTGDPDLTMTGGNVVTYCDLDTVLVEGGTLTIMEGAIGTSLTVNGGTVNYRSDGTAAVVIIGDSGTVDNSQDLSARIFSKCDLYAGATLIAPNATTTTFPAGVDLNQCRISDVTLDLGKDIKLDTTAGPSA